MSFYQFIHTRARKKKNYRKEFKSYGEFEIRIFEKQYFNWKQIYTLAFNVARDTKSREFQYKILI